MLRASGNGHADITTSSVSLQANEMRARDCLLGRQAKAGEGAQASTSTAIHTHIRQSVSSLLCSCIYTMMAEIQVGVSNGRVS